MVGHYSIKDLKDIKEPASMDSGNPSQGQKPEQNQKDEMPAFRPAIEYTKSKPNPPTRWGMLFVVALILFAAAFGYAYFKGLGPFTPEAEIVQFTPRTSLPPDPFEGWQTYRNTKFGYEFRYPENVGLVEDDGTFIGPPASSGLDEIMMGDREQTFRFKVTGELLEVVESSELSDKIISTFRLWETR